MSYRRPITVLFAVAIGLFALGAVVFARSADHPPSIAASAPDSAPPASTDAACAGGPVIDGITLDECYLHNFNVNGAAKQVRVWYTKNQITATRNTDSGMVTLEHWITADSQAVQIGEWFEDAWFRYHTDSGHHLYENGCDNPDLNVQMEDGVGWGGIAYLGSPGNCNIGIDAPKARTGGGQWTVYHEAQHYLQYAYDEGCYGYLKPNYPADSEFVEGYADLGADSVDNTLDVSGYSGNGYDASSSMYDKSYGNRFNKYFIEQLGTVGTPSDSFHRIDALYDHYHECDVQNTLYVLDTLIPALGGISEKQFFLNFFAANWAKNWADPATQPELVYLDDDANSNNWGQPGLTQNVNMAGGTQTWSNATPDDWAARYYQVTPQAGCDYIEMEVDGAAGAQLGINFMAADTSAPTRVLRSAKIGEDYVRTFAANGVFDRLVTVVNSFANNYNYDVTFTCASPAINIREPRQVAPALVGAPDSPIAFLSRVDVTSGGTHVRGLIESNFTFDAGGDAITIVPGSFQEVGDQYWAILLPPVKPAGTTFVNFTACLDVLICDTETNALLYVDPGNTDIALSFDASGSMNTEDVIGEGTRLTNAKRAGVVVADLLRTGDRIGVFDWSAIDNPPGCGLPPDGSGTGNCPFDPRELLARTDVTTLNIVPTLNAARTAINNISARSWTPVGGGVQYAKNKLLNLPSNSNPKHVFLLSDGRENVNPVWADVRAEVIDSGVVVNTIGFGPEAPGALLAQIAADTGGIYRPVPTSGAGSSLVVAAGANALAAMNAPSEIQEALATPFLPGQLGLADVYDYLDTEAQDATRVLHVNYINVANLQVRTTQTYIDKSVNQMRFVVASKQGDVDGDCFPGGYSRSVEVLRPGADEEKGWIQISPPTTNNPPPANWEIRHRVYSYDDVLIVTNPQEGLWKFRTSYSYIACPGAAAADATAAPAAPADLETDFMMNVSVQSTIQLEGRLLGLNNNQGNAGDVVSIIGTLMGREGTIKGAMMAAAVESLNGTNFVLLKDDGLNNDGTADDGIYGALYPHTTVGGSYSVRLVAVFKDPANPANNLVREWNGGFWINGPRPDVECDGRQGDSDCDGMPDDWERRCKLDINKDDSKGDPDRDGLSNIEEWRLGTLPCDADTDNGGERDGSEVRNGRNPLDPRDDKVLVLTHINVRALNKMVLIDWTRPFSFTKLTVYVSDNQDDLGQAVDLGQSTPFSMTGLTNDKPYYLRFVALGDNAEGDYSDVFVVTPKEDPDPPSGAILVNDGAEVTNVQTVTLKISSTDIPLQGAAEGANGHLTDQLSLRYNKVSGGVEMRLANDPLLTDAQWEPLQPEKPWTLACSDGEVCTVYAQFRDAANNESLVINDFIRLDELEQQPQPQTVFLPLVDR